MTGGPSPSPLLAPVMTMTLPSIWLSMAASPFSTDPPSYKPAGAGSPPPGLYWSDDQSWQVQRSDRPLGVLARRPLDGGEAGDLLLPAREVPPGRGPGAVLKVFLYLDADDRVVPTTAVPAAQVREAAFLKIVIGGRRRRVPGLGPAQGPAAALERGEAGAETPGGARPEHPGVRVPGRDGRIAASARLDDFLADEAEGFREGDPVSVLVAERTGLGLRVIVDHRYWGLVHSNEVFGHMPRGRRRKAGSRRCGPTASSISPWAPRATPRWTRPPRASWRSWNAMAGPWP